MRSSERVPQAALLREATARAEALSAVSTDSGTTPLDSSTRSDQPERTYTAAGEVSADSMKASHQYWADDQVTTTSCCFCDWLFEGTALKGREAAKAHREQEHPEACIRKPRRRARMKVRKLRSAGEEEQIAIDTAEARRLRSEREQAEMLAKIEKGRERDRAAALDIALVDV